MRRICAALLGLILLLSLMMSFTGCTSGALQVLDSAGAVLAEVTRETLEEQEPYVQLAVQEAAQLLAQHEGWKTDKAEKKLFGGKYAVCTAYDPQIRQALEDMAKKYPGVNVACAVTDLGGHLLAVYGDYATTRLAPYSSIKPLAVYGPALEKGIITYATPYRDSPVKQVADETGRPSPWPANATGTYLDANVPVADAIRQSLNTIAVRCMQDLGVAESLGFMKERFGLELPFEENRLASLGEEEIVGNVALGFLADGVSPVQMAGYYQTFATLGSYTPPRTVTGLRSSDGTQITGEPQTRQALSEDTAYIMNKMLQNVTSPAGTGAAAGNSQFPVAGKTGTGEGGNWFIGVTPEYSCAVWHDKSLQSNTAAQMFSEAVLAFPSEGLTGFPEVSQVQKMVFCRESGKLVAQGCTAVQLGYFTEDTVPEKCSLHP